MRNATPITAQQAYDALPKGERMTGHTMSRIIAERCKCSYEQAATFAQGFISAGRIQMAGSVGLDPQTVKLYIKP